MYFADTAGFCSGVVQAFTGWGTLFRVMVSYDIIIPSKAMSLPVQRKLMTSLLDEAHLLAAIFEDHSHTQRDLWNKRRQKSSAEKASTSSPSPPPIPITSSIGCLTASIFYHCGLFTLVTMCHSADRRLYQRDSRPKHRGPSVV